MKISRLKIKNFAIDESPSIDEQSISGKDILLYGGNRSGKTLTFNAILYALYGRSGTFGIAPGQRSKVSVHFDNSDAVDREHNHQYNHDDELMDATEGVETYIGNKESVRLQFITSNPANQPISSLSGEAFLDKIRDILSSEHQSRIERHRRAKTELEHLEEKRQRGGDRPNIEKLENKLESIPISQTENRIEEINELQRLIETGEIENINSRLQRKDKVAEQLNNLYDQRRTIEQKLKQKNEELGDLSRYTKKVNDLIIDAIDEFTCPVCGELVEEPIARSRLPNQCPQCGRPRNLSELRGRLREKVESADTKISKIKDEISNLSEELASVKAEIKELQDSEPELQDLNQFIRTALKQAEHDLKKLDTRTSKELDNYEKELTQFKSQKEELEAKLQDRKELLTEIRQSIEFASEEIERLEKEAFNGIRDKFTEKLSNVYKNIAPDLGTNIGLTPAGKLEFPGTGSEGVREYNRLSSGERRLVNLAFALTIAEFSKENEDAHNWEVVVIDEPLTNLESDIQDAAARYLRNADIQVVITSPLDRIKSHFQDNRADIIPLERIETQNSTLDEYL